MMSPALQEKVARAAELVRHCIATYKRPVISSSFGKDSMVLLSIIESVVKGLPVLFYREPFCPEKYSFANKVIAQRGYVVYDYPPSATAVIAANGNLEIVNAYQVGPKSFIHLPTGIAPPVEGQPPLCGYSDIYDKPTGSYVYPWDLVFIGHKSSDSDPIHGAIPLNRDVQTNVGAPDAAFPLRYFTDDDIWRYTEANDLPIHTERYDPENGYQERPDTTANPDYFPACVACMDPAGADTVYCPKLHCEINHRRGQIRYADPKALPSYIVAGQSK